MNGIDAPYNLVIGQELKLPGNAAPPRPLPRTPSTTGIPAPSSTALASTSLGPRKPAWTVPARGSLFLVLRTVAANGKLVRKVVPLPPTDIAALVVNNPQQFGFHPRNMNGVVSLGEHALGDTMSRYISASTKPHGAPNFNGDAWYIDIPKLQKEGIRIHSTQEIIQDLDRIHQNATPELQARIARLKGVIDSHEGEVLVEGHIPASAVQSAEAAAREMTLFKTLGHAGRVVTVVGVVFTAYDLEQASVRSVESHSVRPIAAETVRQAGGWGGGFLGGFALGAALGIETGPGAIITGLVGGVIGGIAGYAGGDWAAKKIDPGH